MIHILDGQEDIILDYIVPNGYWDDNHKRSLEETLETYQFFTFADRSFSQYIEKRNRIIIQDQDENLIEFVLFEVIEDRINKEKFVVANASYLELKKASIIYPNTFEGTVSQHAGRSLNNTGWQVGIVEGKGTRTIRVENHTNPYEMLRRIAKEFDLELKFRVEHDNRRITGRYVDLLERVGEWRGREVEFGKDLAGLKRVEKQNVVTALLGLGPEDEDGNRLEVLVEDVDALQRWGRVDEHGNLHHLIEPYEIQSDRMEMTEEEARQYTRTALDKRINTQVTYEGNIVDLENVPGLENKKIRFGDTIRIKDTHYDPPLYLEARIFEEEGSNKEKARKDVKLGDYIEYTEEQVHAIWKQLQQQIRDRITVYDLAEYTYDKLTIDRKDEHVFDEGKTFAEAIGIEAKEYADDQDGIIKTDLEVYAEHQAESALSSAKQYAVAKEVYESQMEIIASDIADRAPITYVDGQLQIVDDRLDDFNIEIEEKADKSTVYTISQVDTMINNKVSVTQYETDMNGIVTDLESHGTRIGQNEEAIGLKADRSYVDGVESSLTTQIGNIEVTAEGAKMTASEVRADLDSRTSIHDTRDDNEPPSYYWDNYSKETIHEFKRRTTLGISSGETYGILTTVIPWSDPSGGVIKQTFKLDSKTYERASVSRTDDNWTEWIETESTEGAQVKIDGAVSVLDASIETLAGEVSLKASQSVVDSLEGRVSTTESELSVLPGQIATKVDDGEARSIFQQEAGSFTFSADQINFDGHIFGQNATFDGKIVSTRGNDTVTIDDASFYGERIDSSSNFTYESELTPHSLLLSQKSTSSGTKQSGLFLNAGGLFFGPDPVPGGWDSDIEASIEVVPGLDSDNNVVRSMRLDAYGVVIPTDLTLSQASTGNGTANGIIFGDTYNGGSILSIHAGDFTLYGNRANGYPFKLRTHNNRSAYRNDFYIGTDGTIFSNPTYDNTSGNTANVRIASVGGEYRFYRSTSAKKYKIDIKPIDVDCYRILDIVPHSWHDKEEVAMNDGNSEGLERYYGIIADDFVEVGLPEYVDYIDGEIENINERAWTLLIPITKDHEVKLTEHEREIFKMKNEINTLRNEVDQLKGVA